MKPKRIFVTGATGGIGGAIVHHFVGDGHTVIAADIVAADAPQGSTSENFIPLAFDIRDTEAATAAITEGVKAAGGLDALINVAGVCYGGDPETASPEEWDATFEINVKGMFQLTRAALPYLRQQPRSDIVNVSSIWGVDHTFALLSYSASKFAVEGYTGGLRMWGMPKNVRVCSIQVDKVDTGFRRNLGAAGEFPQEKLDRMLNPDDVASAVAFVMSTPETAQVSSMRLDAPLWYQG
jgi:NADP-dependent 3-hydroxy acid dehydrogenase YdfG